MKKTVMIIWALFQVFSAIGQDIADTLAIDEFIVTGSRIEVLRNTMPLSVSVLNRNDINAIEESAVLPVISRKIPGMFVTERGVTGFGVGSTSAGQITVRGVGAAPNTQVLILVDGQPQYMGIFGHPLPNSYVASDLERVEVIRGPGSILYGSNAMGGVVNLISRKQQHDGFQGNARLAYGSYNTSKLMFNGGYKRNDLSLFASINRDQTDGHRDNSQFEITNALLKANYQINRYLDISADYNIAVFQSVDPGRNFVEEDPFVADIVRGRASFSIRNDYESIKGALVAFLNFGDHELSDGWISRDENMGISLYQGISLPYNTWLTAGADFKKLGGRGSAGIAANQWNTIEETAVYALVRHEFLEQVFVTYGARLENNSFYGNELLPQGGISWNIVPETVVRASVSKGFRSPTVMETYLFMPNPNLEPERLISYETGIGQQFLQGRLHAEVNVFLLEGSNIMQVVPNPDAPPPMRRINAGEFRNKGLEMELKYNPTANIQTSVSYSYLDIERPLLAAPQHQLFAGTDYRMGDLRFAIQGHFVGGLYTFVHNPQTQTSADDILENYLLLNASAAWRPIRFAEIFISGKNLLNQSYQINHGYPMPGIHFMSGVNFNF